MDRSWGCTAVVAAVLGMAGCGTATTPSGTSCTHATGCSSGQVCVGGVCEDPVACASSRACPGLVCDTTRGVCADCMTSRDCAAGRACVLGVCEIPCAGECDAGVADGAVPSDGDVPDATAVDSGADATPVDAGGDAGPIDSGADAATIDAAMPATWEVVPSATWPLYGGLTDVTPVGETSAYALAGNTTTVFARFDAPAHAWTALTAPTETGSEGAARALAGPAWIGDALYVMYGAQVHRYDIATDRWASLATIHSVVQSQSAHDDAGHVYALAEDLGVVVYDVASSDVRYLPLPLAGVTPAIPRVVWDPSALRLFVVPTILANELYAVDVATGDLNSQPGIPGAGTLGPLFCGDREGHLFATAGTIGDAAIWRYDTLAHTWSPMADLPFPHGQNGQCTVIDGQLYVLADSTNVARIRLR